MNRAANFLFMMMAIGLNFAPMARAETGSAASEVAALRQELRALAARNQQQIDALQRQVGTLSAELKKSRSASARAASVPAARGLPTEPRPGADVPRVGMPMLPPEMSNLPGRSVVSPYTAAGPGVPGAAPKTPAAWKPNPAGSNPCPTPTGRQSLTST